MNAVRSTTPDPRGGIIGRVITAIAMSRIDRPWRTIIFWAVAVAVSLGVTFTVGLNTMSVEETLVGDSRAGIAERC